MEKMILRPDIDQNANHTSTRISCLIASAAFPPVRDTALLHIITPFEIDVAVTTNENTTEEVSEIMSKNNLVTKHASRRFFAIVVTHVS